MAYHPDPRNGWDSLVKSPPGTDPDTARAEYTTYFLTGNQSVKLHLAAIGSFRIIATADTMVVGGCHVKLDIWMYNEMSSKSFGKFADHPYFKYRPMSSQFMWWHWKEYFKFDKSGNTTDSPINDRSW